MASTTYVWMTFQGQPDDIPSDWFILYPNGDLKHVPSGQIVKQSTSFKGCTYDGIPFDKSAGEGEPLLIQLPTGLVVFKYKKGQWYRMVKPK